jgi:Fur family ferric uptake transcriptional regulator
MSTRTASESMSVPADIQARLERAGLRRTLATRAVLGLFLTHRGASLSHAQVFASLGARGLKLNRVTLYRLLERLAAAGVLERHVDEHARTWHFKLVGSGGVRLMAHFECDTCHQYFPIHGAPGSANALASELMRQLADLGHQAVSGDLVVHGACAECLPPRGGAQALGSRR